MLDSFSLPEQTLLPRRHFLQSAGLGLGGVALAAVFLIPVGEGLADLVGEGFEFLLLAFLGLGVAGGGGLLGGEEAG